MQTEPFERLQQARERAGYGSAREAAQAFGWGYSTYASHENGSRGMRIDAARRYARAFKTTVGWLLTGSDEKQTEPQAVPSIPVVGKVAAGVWMEAEQYELPEGQPLIPAAPSYDFPPRHQIALRIEGTSMNKLFPDGAFVIGVLFEHARSPRNGDVVAVRRSRAGLVETTVKRYTEKDGTILLMPESSDPRFQTPVEMRSNESDTQVEIFALIIGSYMPL